MKKRGCWQVNGSMMVPLAHNKVAMKCHRYFGPINSETCKSFIDEQFSDMFKILFIQKENYSFKMVTLIKTVKLYVRQWILLAAEDSRFHLVPQT